MKQTMLLWLWSYDDPIGSFYYWEVRAIFMVAICIMNLFGK